MHLVWNDLPSSSVYRTYDGAVEVLRIYGCYLGAGLSVYIFTHYRGAVGASGGVYGSTACSSSFVSSSGSRISLHAFMLLMGIDVA